MALLVPNASEERFLKAMLNHTAQNENPVLQLFSSNTTPGETDTIATYTLVSSNFDNSTYTLTGGSWTVTNGSASYAQQTFTATGAAGNIYGYVVKRATGGELLWAERFTDAPYNIQNVGDQIKITPAITLD